MLDTTLLKLGVCEEVGKALKLILEQVYKSGGIDLPNLETQTRLEFTQLLKFVHVLKGAALVEVEGDPPSMCIYPTELEDHYDFD